VTEPCLVQDLQLLGYLNDDLHMASYTLNSLFTPTINAHHTHLCHSCLEKQVLRALACEKQVQPALACPMSASTRRPREPLGDIR
jgi:hypothetical protein